MHSNSTGHSNPAKRDRSNLDTSSSSEGSESSPSSKPPELKRRTEMALTKADLDILGANISPDMKTIQN
jgi:hypothetical protein